MRTTLNLDPELAAQIAALAREEATSRSRVVNDLVRAGLRARRRHDEVEPYDPPTVDTGRPLLDVSDVAGALEVLDERG